MSRYWNDQKNEPRVWPIARDVLLSLFMFILLLMFGCPVYNVWEKGQAGKAALRKAEQDRQIRIEEAKAKEQAAQYEAEAEIIRARGVAEANQIVAEGLGGPEGYLRYLYLQALGEHAGKLGQVIYVPTEAGLPILEAGRLNGHKSTLED